MEVGFLLHNLDLIVIAFFGMGVIALLFLVYALRILFLIARKVNRMSPAMEVLTAKITALQASVDALKARLVATPATPAVTTDEADATAAAAIVDSLKTEVDSLVPVAG